MQELRFNAPFLTVQGLGVHFSSPFCSIPSGIVETEFPMDLCRQKKE